jgi:hypothetical protein
MMVSHFQKSPPFIVEAVVNNSLKVFGRADVSMQTLDLNESVRKNSYIDGKYRRLTFQWAVDVSVLLLERPNLNCKSENWFIMAN